MGVFTAKERDAGDPCFVVAEGTTLVIDLNPPASIEQAEQVASFLNKNVKDLTIKNGTIELVKTEDGQPGEKTIIGGGRSSLFN